MLLLIVHNAQNSTGSEDNGDMAEKAMKQIHCVSVMDGMKMSDRTSRSTFVADTLEDWKSFSA